jgi:hypothetical protein
VRESRGVRACEWNLTRTYTCVEEDECVQVCMEEEFCNLLRLLNEASVAQAWPANPDLIFSFFFVPERLRARVCVCVCVWRGGARTGQDA